MDILPTPEKYASMSRPSEAMIDFWKFLYEWASSQPVFIQVALGIGIVLVGIYLTGWCLGILFMTYLRKTEKKNKRYKIEEEKSLGN